MATLNEGSSKNVLEVLSAGNVAWADSIAKLEKEINDLHKLESNLQKNRLNLKKQREVEIAKEIAELNVQKQEELIKKQVSSARLLQKAKAELALQHEKDLNKYRDRLIKAEAKKKESEDKKRNRIQAEYDAEKAEREASHQEKMLEYRFKQTLSNEALLQEIRMDSEEAVAEAAFNKRKERLKAEFDLKKKYDDLAATTDDANQKNLIEKRKQKEIAKLNRKNQSEDAQPRMEANGVAIAEGIKSGDWDSVKKALGDTMKQAGAELGDALEEAGNKLKTAMFNQASAAVDSSISLLAGRQSKIVASLQGSSEDFKDINARMGVVLAASPFIKYTEMLDKVEALVDKGIAYNVEQRSFLASISDKIAHTFDAFDSNLLQIIRIQQEDSTKQRLGMEASLTKFLNSQYQDTSYLSGVHDEVTKALTASIVQLGTAKGAEFEFAVQKWFGSLSALGMDDSTLTGLAGAIEALSTGDVETLANSSYQNLIVMAANQSGMSYADILTQGLNAESVNSLLSNIVAYWSSIANQGNQVVKNKYAELFGLSMTDMTAIRNITQNDLTTIYNKDLSYTQMNTELINQLAQIPGRMHTSEMLSNVIDNVLTGIGMNIASSPGAAATWSINKFIKDNTGGINIPAITSMVMGTGLGFDINTDVNSLIQLGMVGISTLGQVGKIIGGLGGLGGLNLNAWGADQYTRHGQGLGSIVTGVSTSTSQTTFIGNSDSSSMYQSTLNKAYNDERITEVKAQADESIDQQKEQMNNIEDSVVHIYDLLSNVFTGSALRVYVEDYGLTSTFGAT